LEEKIKARIQELNLELDTVVEEIKSFQASKPEPNLESLEKTDTLTKKLLIYKSALAELNALLEN
jgi:uncharacterized membrane protein